MARSILPTSGPDPNRDDSPARDEHTRATSDHLWKVITPRWPVSADGKWYWKSDTSSDELDGHFFFYALYYDLVADTEEERHRVREHVAAIAGHLIDHNFQFVDHDGKPTRWGIFNPENLNHNFDWREERGTNSLSILAYLQVAAHITGEPRFAAAARGLIERHAYAANVLIPKSDTGPGSGNQSDDEMIFMNYYNLIRYETDPVLKEDLRFGPVQAVAVGAAGDESVLRFHLCRQLQRADGPRRIRRRGPFPQEQLMAGGVGGHARALPA